MWLGTSGYAVAAGPGTPRFTPPVILSSTGDLKDNVIVISGHDFRQYTAYGEIGQSSPASEKLFDNPDHSEPACRHPACHIQSYSFHHWPLSGHVQPL